MLVDEAACPVAHESQRLAARLDIHLVWLPKQCPELNAMDQLWKELTTLERTQRPCLGQSSIRQHRRACGLCGDLAQEAEQTPSTSQSWYLIRELLATLFYPITFGHSLSLEIILFPATQAPG